MAQKLDPKETVTFKDFLIANAIQIDALCQLLIEKGLIMLSFLYHLAARRGEKIPKREEKKSQTYAESDFRKYYMGRGILWSESIDD